MKKIKIFNGSAEEQEIFDELKLSGIVGVSGGRLQVRNKLENVQILIEENDLESYFAQSTINHPCTELGYGYDENRYSMEEAKGLVTNSYDAQVQNI
jgi:hypothetical protein